MRRAIFQNKLPRLVRLFRCSRSKMSKLKTEIHPFLTQEVVDALASKQVHTVLDFIRADTQQILKAARLNFREVVAVRNFLLKTFSATPANGFDCYKTALKNTAIIPTGIESVDRLLDGGLFTGNIYEICGLPAAGKTHFVLSLVKNLVQNMQLQVYIFDTKNDFSGTRIKNMLDTRDEVRQRKSLSNILLNRAYTRYDLINTLYALKASLENGFKLRLIIIDSLPSVILNSNNNKTNNAYLNNLVNIMRYIATKHHVAFLVTNLIRTWTTKDAQDSENVCLGRYWFSVPNTRLKIENLEDGDSFKVTVLSSDIVRKKMNNCANIRYTDKGFLS